MFIKPNSRLRTEKRKPSILLLSAVLPLFFLPSHVDEDPLSSAASLEKEWEYGTALNLSSLVRFGPLNIDNEERGKTAFVLGRIFLERGIFDEIDELFDVAGTGLPLLSDYCGYYKARVLEGGGEKEKALQAYLAYIDIYPGSVLRNEATTRAIGLFAELKRCEEAAVLLRELSSRAPVDAMANLEDKLASCYEEAGEYDEAARGYRKIWFDYPLAKEAERAGERLRLLSGARDLSLTAPGPDDYLKRADRLRRGGRFSEAAQCYEKILDEAGDRKVSESALFGKGLCHYFMRDNESAIGVFKLFLDKFPHSSSSGKARIRLARLYWRLEDERRFMATLGALTQGKKAVRGKSEALYLLSAFCLQKGDVPEGARYFKRLRALSPRSGWTKEILWKLGWRSYRAGKLKEAIDYMDRLWKGSSPGDELGRAALFWRGMAAREEKADPSAYFCELINRAPYSYYGYRALDMLRRTGEGKGAEECGLGGHEKADRLEFPDVDFSEESSEEEGLEKIRLLYELGLADKACDESKKLDQTAGKNMSLSYRCANYCSLSGSYRDGAMMLLDVFGSYAREGGEDIPEEFWKIIYPIPYREKLRYYAEKYGVDPFLVSSIIRQESFFDAKIVSFAGAIGLMQIMPSTGEGLARELGMSDYEPYLLKNPEVSLHLGTYYISELIKRYDNDVARAVAAYNAGEERVDGWSKSWREGGGGAPLLFIEEIPYRETRGYVKKVIKNYRRYLEIYGGVL